MLPTRRNIMQVVFAVIVSTLLLAACNSGSSSPAAVPAATLKSIAVTPTSASTALNFDIQLTATGTYSDTTSQNITTSVTWSSSSAVVATVNASTGLVTPASGATAGQTTEIIATSGTLSGKTTLTLAPAATLNSIAVSPQNSSVALNSVLQLTATGTYSNSRTKNITSLLTWSSGNTSVATVDAVTGLVTPAGGATIGQTAVITATGLGMTPATATVRLAGATFSLATVAEPLALQQWGLRNTGQNGYADTSGTANTGGTLGTDINANPVYSTYGYTGWGVIVAVVDSGMEIAHEDLAANVVPGGSWNFKNLTTDPTSTATTGDHGTMVSGLIAMALNGKGGVGVAPNAQLKGFNYLGGGVASDANLIVSLGGKTSSPNSSDVAIFNQSFGTGNPVDFLVTRTVEDQYSCSTTGILASTGSSCTIPALRGGKGALFVKSAGNGFKNFYFQTSSSVSYETDGCNLSGGANAIGISCQNANFDPYNTLPYNIVMAALSAKGKKSSYSTAGSAIWASAPGGEYGNNVAAMNALGVASSNPTGYDPAMVTTDQSGCTVGESRNPPVAGLVANGGPYSYFNQGGTTNVGGVNTNCNYTNSMNGTSSAAPMMTGSIALLLEANPNLTWRDVKDILARTAVKVDSGIAPVSVALGNGSYVAEQAWTPNAAGLNFHNWYGFGAVNVSAAVEMAKTYTTGSLGTFVNTDWTPGTLPATTTIPDNSTAGVIVTAVVPSFGAGAANIVEAVQIQVTTSATNGYAGDLGIELTSPSGTKSILKNIRDGFSGGGASVNTTTNAVTYYGGTLSGMVLASNAFYGESSVGTNGQWTIKVLDGWAGHGIQTLTNAQIRIYGH